MFRYCEIVFSRVLPRDRPGAWVCAFLQYPPGMTTTGYILSLLLAPCSLLLDAGVSGIFVHQMWTLRCPKCGYWSLSIPRSGFKQTGDIDEDGWRILERKKCQFRKRGGHKDEHRYAGSGDGF